MSYNAIRQMYNAYQHRPKLYVDWQNILSHDDVNSVQVSWLASTMFNQNISLLGC